VQRDRDWQRQDERDWRRPDYRGRDMRYERGAGPYHNWYRGSRLPPEYHSRHYVVEDWRGHHLSAPPRGYHWVQAGSDYLLVAIATGVIAQLLLSN
jgi:Ni/Co efflux regulator RcnB